MCPKKSAAQQLNCTDCDDSRKVTPTVGPGAESGENPQKLNSAGGHCHSTSTTKLGAFPFVLHRSRGAGRLRLMTIRECVCVCCMLWWVAGVRERLPKRCV
jgi:hypothetical protein